MRGWNCSGWPGTTSRWPLKISRTGPDPARATRHRRPPVSMRSTAAPRASSQPATKSVARLCRSGGRCRRRSAARRAEPRPPGQDTRDPGVHRQRRATPKAAGLPWISCSPRSPPPSSSWPAPLPRPPSGRSAFRRAAGSPSPARSAFRPARGRSRPSPWSAASAPPTATARSAAGAPASTARSPTGWRAGEWPCCGTTSAASVTRPGRTWPGSTPAPSPPTPAPSPGRWWRCPASTPRGSR